MSSHSTDRQYIGALMSKPPFDGIDAPMLNFLRNTAHSTSQVNIDIHFRNETGQSTFHAHIMTGHSPNDLSAGAVLLALKEYTRITGEHMNWHSAQIRDNYTMTCDELNALITADNSQFLHLLMADDMSPTQAMQLAVDAILAQNDNGKMVTKEDINNAFLPVHTALLNQETAILLKDNQGQDIKPQNRRNRFLSGMRRALFKPE